MSADQPSSEDTFATNNNTNFYFVLLLCLTVSIVKGVIISVLWSHTVGVRFTNDLILSKVRKLSSTLGITLVGHIKSKLHEPPSDINPIDLFEIYQGLNYKQPIGRSSRNVVAMVRGLSAITPDEKKLFITVVV